MQTYVKRVVYPRTDVHPDGWLSFAAQVNQTRAVVEQLAGGFRTPDRERFSVLAHGLWGDDLAWQSAALAPPADTYGPLFFPAIDQLAQSFRVRRPAYQRPGRVGVARFDKILVGPAVAQQLESFRMADRVRLLRDAYSVSVDSGWIGANIPIPEFSPAWMAALGQTLAARSLADRRQRRGLDLLWNAHMRSFGLVVEDEAQWSPAFAQSLGGFRPDASVHLDLRVHEWEAQTGWLSFAEREGNVTQQRPALEQLLGGFRVPRRAGYVPSLHEWLDLGSWLSQIAQFDPAFWPAIGDLLRAFRAEDHRRLDVRLGDVPQDAWLGFEIGQTIPGRSAAYVELWESYRMAARRTTMDAWRSEWQHDMAWLRGVLDLTDAEPVTANDVAERWAGSNRRRQRSRRR